MSAGWHHGITSLSQTTVARRQKVRAGNPKILSTGVVLFMISNADSMRETYMGREVLQDQLKVGSQDSIKTGMADGERNIAVVQEPFSIAQHTLFIRASALETGAE